MRDFSLTGNDSVKFMFQKCGRLEAIFRDVDDLLDGTDLAFSAPQFTCEACGAAMSVVYYKNQLGYQFKLEDV